jgi:nucleotide-binding universal stress UspA family protein
MGAVFGARFTLLRVVSPFTFQVSADLEPSAPLSPLNREAAVQYLNSAASRLRETQTSVTAHVIEAGSPAPAIMDYAETHGADLIVLSSSGAGGVKRLLLGSVADSIVRGTDVPVVVCNARHATEPDTVLAGHEGEQIRA